MENTLVLEEIHRLSRAFSYFFITPAEFLTECDALFAMLLIDHPTERLLQVLEVLELAISAFQASVCLATLSLTISDPPNMQPEPWTVMALLMHLAEQAVSSSPPDERLSGEQP